MKEEEAMDKICRFCGNVAEGVSFESWVKPTFTDHDKLQPGEIVCQDCLFWLNERSQDLATRMGKEKPQRMRNYSHFVVSGEWKPLSKAHKAEVTALLLGASFPELAVIAESGQKHIVFRARRNPPGAQAGWVQFEEQSIWLEPDALRALLVIIEPALAIFAKGEIATGQYKPHRIRKYSLERWQELEAAIRAQRGAPLLKLALFLAQKQEDEHGRINEGNGYRPARNHLAGDRQRLQKSLPANDMEPIREHGASKRLHQQSRQIRQLSLFEAGSTDSSENGAPD